MDAAPAFVLNGRRIALTGDPTDTLLRWLHRQGLRGSKEGCGDGDCGACTVVLVERDAGSGRFVAVNSCLLPLGSLPGREVFTVEALADGDGLHPVQRVLADCGGSQCGYCTPGFVMSLFAGYYAGTLGDDCVEGNLCRCTGYVPIRAAAAQLAAQRPGDDRFRGWLAQPAASAPVADLADFHQPDTLADALRLKQQHADAQWIAGATDLGVDFSRGRNRGRPYIALDRVAELQALTIDDDAVCIGAGVPLSRVEHELAGMFPALDLMLPWFAGRQVRNRATLGGNLGTASPIGDLLPILLALDAEIELHGAAGARRLPIDQFFLGYRQTARRDDELIHSVRLPRQAGLINASFKVAKRQTDDISIVAAAFALRLDALRRVEHVRLAFGGVAATPVRARCAETFLLGRILDQVSIDATVAMLRDEFTPLSDHRAGADYRRALCGSLFAKFASEALP